MNTCYIQRQRSKSVKRTGVYPAKEEAKMGIARIADPWYRLSEENSIVGFVDSLLRGVGQVMFQDNPLTGLLFLVGIFVNSWQLGISAIIGVLVSTVTALLLGADRTLIRAGLFGYNGVLLGVALSFFLVPPLSVVMVVYIIIGAIFTAVILAALANLLSVWDMPALTAPFVLATWLLLFAIVVSTHFTAGAAIAPVLPKPNAAVDTMLRATPMVAGAGAGPTFINLVQAVFRGVGEVFFQNNFVTGIIFVLAILVNSRISALFAVLGSIVGLATALVLLGADGYAVYIGLYGFNGVLCAIAIGGVFYMLTWQSAIYALVCALVSAIVFAAMTVMLAPLGMPALTAPFVLTAWLFLLPKGAFHVLQPVSLIDVNTPERIIQLQQEKVRQAELST
jgi:urea transporter